MAIQDGAIQNAGSGQGPPILDRVVRFFPPNETSAFLVGGYLRDLLISRAKSLDPTHDLDIAVTGDVERIARDLAGDLGGSTVPLSPSRGVFRVVVPGTREAESGDAGEDKPWTIDLTAFSGDIQEDLSRRDFCVDAMALAIHDRDKDDWLDRIIDPFHGRQDLVKKRIRAVSPSIFREDPGRLLRSVRLASQLGFALDPETVNLVRAEAHRVSLVSAERIRDEFLAILAMVNAKGYLVILDRLDLLCRVIPELEATKGVEQPVVHYWDVWGHILHCVETAELVTQGHQNSPVFMFVPWTPESQAYFNEDVAGGYSRRTVLKLAALFHDIAKPQTKAIDETGRTRFLGHSELGATMAAQRLTQLRLSSRAVAMVSRMVEHHLRPGNMSQGAELPTARAIHRYFRDVDDVAVDTLYLALADHLAAKGPNLSMEQWSAHARMIGHILEAGSEQPESAGPARLITGHDLIAHLGLEPGPLVGRILETVIEAQALGEIHTREEALALAEQTVPELRARE
ncbi:MAG: hypothetical protein BZY88_01715 [SAR202 cluster bacterium Io17-Chloro-G9]|nr:MAG: hypothetical protein BZY88_01715 [SAR202 cluster bacterium Io17-Chloro-G9]